MKNLHFVLWVMDQNHVGDLSIWVSPSSLMALFAGLCISLALRLATFASWFLLFPACGVGLPYGWLTAEARQTLSGLLRPAYARCERVGYPLYCGEVRCPHMQRHRLHAFVKGFWSLHYSPDIIVFVIHVPMTSSYAASSRIHSRSPVRSSPSPDQLCG